MPSSKHVPAWPPAQLIVLPRERVWLWSGDLTLTIATHLDFKPNPAQQSSRLCIFVVCAGGALWGTALVIYVILPLRQDEDRDEHLHSEPGRGGCPAACWACFHCHSALAAPLALWIRDMPHRPTVDSMNQFTSIFFLTVMSFDRYLAVVHPIKSTKWRKPRMAKIISLAMWGISLLVNLPIMIYSGREHQKERGSDLSHVVAGATEPPTTPLSSSTPSSWGFLLPLIISPCAYLLIVIKGEILRHASRAPPNGKRSERKVHRMVSIVVVVVRLMLVTFLRIQRDVWTGTVPTTTVLKSTFDFVVVLGYATAAPTPILYAFLSDNFKKSFQNVCV